ncbi:MAG: hypothetical protein DHS20C03_08720 [Minwuia thermotolerans]|nr:MAG: hypothetical protein DHS20C03_08720 [Minwuia thermotolerans]
MTIQEQLLTLQWAQLKHDEDYHKDIVLLPPASRVRHMALHNTKYTGYLFDAVETHDEIRFMKILTDAFIITLASANTLNQDLGGELGGEADGAPTLLAFGRSLADSLPRDPSDPLWLVRQFARHNGRLAKVCESWDHLEPIPFADTMKSCNALICKAVLAEAGARKFDLVAAYETRIREVEARSIFDLKFREDAGGEA